jgi:hypothetical protein
LQNGGRRGELSGADAEKEKTKCSFIAEKQDPIDPHSTGELYLYFVPVPKEWRQNGGRKKAAFIAEKYNNK